MRQYCERKIQEEDGFWVSLLIEIILKEKLAMQNTFSKTKVGDTWTILMCVTLAISPLGNLTEIWTMEVIEVKNFKEWTIWSVAPLSRIQLMDRIWEVLTTKEKLNILEMGKTIYLIAHVLEDQLKAEWWYWQLGEYPQLPLVVLEYQNGIESSANQAIADIMPKWDWPLLFLNL